MHMGMQRRRQLIVKMLDTDDPRTQEQLVAALAKAGEPATQATISRDLAALGAVRGPEGYMLTSGADEQPQMGDDLARLLRAHALTVEPADSLIVIKTAPGHAQLLAVGFDRNRPKGIVGCIAGDDTIFLATTSTQASRRVLKALRTQLSGAAV